jgi:hypothetical protein
MSQPRWFQPPPASRRLGSMGDHLCAPALHAVLRSRLRRASLAQHFSGSLSASRLNSANRLAQVSDAGGNRIPLWLGTGSAVPQRQVFEDDYGTLINEQTTIR